MKRPLGLVLLALVAGSAQAFGQNAPDAVAIDPAHHHVLFENDHVRVFEAFAAPGDTSPMHSHPPLVLVSLDKARARIRTPDGATSILDLNPGMVAWLEDVEHAWEILAGQVHLFAVETKSAGAGQAPAAIVPDPREAVVVDPSHHHVVFENEHVRVFEAQAEPGDASPMHNHPPTVLISFADGRVRMTLPDGSTPIFDLNPGQAFWVEGVEHSWEVLSGIVHAYGVEVKAARPKSP